MCQRERIQNKKEEEEEERQQPNSGLGIIIGRREKEGREIKCRSEITDKKGIRVCLTKMHIV